MEASQVEPLSIALIGFGLRGGHERLAQLECALFAGLLEYALLLLLFEFLPGLLKCIVVQTES